MKYIHFYEKDGKTIKVIKSGPKEIEIASSKEEKDTWWNLWNERAQAFKDARRKAEREVEQAFAPKFEAIRTSHIKDLDTQNQSNGNGDGTNIA